MNNLSFIAHKQKLKQSKRVKLHFVKFQKIVFVRERGARGKDSNRGQS